jgi:hypothetical protein
MTHPHSNSRVPQTRANSDAGTQAPRHPTPASLTPSQEAA